MERGALKYWRFWVILALSVAIVVYLVFAVQALLAVKGA